MQNSNGLSLALNAFAQYPLLALLLPSGKNTLKGLQWKAPSGLLFMNKPVV
jgi:hypothetical protein